MNCFGKLLLAPALAFGLPGVSVAIDPPQGPPAPCSAPDLVAAINVLKSGGLASLPLVVGPRTGGIFNPKTIWWAIVDRAGRLCAVDKFGVDPWPDSRAIAIAKAGTANGFSNDRLALSTANLYAATQPGGVFYGLNNSNPFNAVYLPAAPLSDEPSAINRVAGGIITHGGGVALYSGGQVIGGLGISGDTPCMDHAIAYATRRDLLHLNQIPVAPPGLNPTDNIIYPRGNDKPSGFEHPRCVIDFGHGKGGHHHDRDDKDDKDDKGDKHGKDDKDKRDGKGGKY